MADNVILNSGSGGATLATDDVAGVQFQRVKVTWGPDGTCTDVDIGVNAIPIKDGGNSITVDGTVSVSGTVTVDGSGVTQPVSGTVTANAGTNLNTSALALESGGNLATVAALSKAEDAAHSSGHTGVMALAVREATATDLSAGNTDGDYEPLQVDASGRLWVNASGAAVPVTDNSGSLTVDNGGTFAVQAAQSGTWTVQPGNTANTTAWKVDGSAVTQPVSGTVTVSSVSTSIVPGTAATNLGKAEDAAHSSGDTGVMLLAVREATATDLSAGNTDGDYEPLQVNASGRLWVSATVDAALPAGTNGIGKLTSNSGVTIGAVEIAAAQTLATVTTCSTVTTVSTLTGGGVAHDGADSGNPNKIGMRAKSSLTGITLVSADDRSDTFCDVDGVTIVKTGAPSGNVVSERVSNTDGASTAFSTFGAAANLRNFITAITITNTHASTNGYVDFRDGTAGSVIWTCPAPATGGMTHNFDPPLRQPTANTALAYDVSAAITTVIISINGFQSKA